MWGVRIVPKVALGISRRMGGSLPLEKFELRDQNGFQPATVLHLRGVRPAPHRPLFFSGRFVKGRDAHIGETKAAPAQVWKRNVHFVIAIREYSDSRLRPIH
jgi:hypothetical protein